MHKMQFVHLAENAIIDKYTNNLSIISIIDGFQGVSFPFVTPPFAIAFQSERNVATDPSIVKTELIIRQKGKELHRGNIDVNYEDKSSHRGVIKINGLVVEEPSPIEIIFMCEGRELAKIPIIIKNITPQVDKK
ncbi:MAG: hypothetical protein ABSG22_03140 [Sedimentisphaerales bacterium]